MENLPKNMNEWFIDISEAYKDAADTVPFAKMLKQELTEGDLFHLAPEICLKRREIKRTKKNIETAREAALCSYVATQDNLGDSFKNPILTFSLSYLASHLGLDIISEVDATKILNNIENNIEKIENGL